MIHNRDKKKTHTELKNGTSTKEEGKILSAFRKFMTFMTLSKLMNHAVLSSERQEEFCDRENFH